MTVTIPTPNSIRLGLAALALLPTLAMTLTGCVNVTADQPELHPTRAAIEESRLVEWTIDPDLSRDDVGMVDGERSAIYDSLDADHPYRARLTLPDGTVIDQTVKYVAAWAESDDGPPCSITLNHDLMAAADAESVLDGYRTALGLDADRVAGWRDHHDAVVAAGAGGTVARSQIFTAPVGDVEATVEVGTNRTTGNVLVTVDLRRC
ncbi:MAG: hypothetical protein OEZ14_06455 [Acidimicrobiia bacterium]|nr:hypothetical protein [Acidimicrobiia bacterium]MDH5520157.1 hypothetical protein [Acidimicrobiia bacterium]